METEKNSICTCKTNFLLRCDYKDLCALVLTASAESPVLALNLGERDLSYLTHRVKPDGDSRHLEAGIRMACAFFGVGDPFPEYVSDRSDLTNMR